MIARRTLPVFVAALFALATLGSSAWAQITTGIGRRDPSRTRRAESFPARPSILTNEAQGTKSAPVVTNDTGDFVFPNVPAGTYTVEVSMPSFKTYQAHRRRRWAPATVPSLGSMTLEVGGATETVEVKAEAPMIQATTGERSFTITTESVENLPHRQPQLHRARRRSRRASPATTASAAAAATTS